MKLEKFNNRQQIRSTTGMFKGIALKLTAHFQNGRISTENELVFVTIDRTLFVPKILQNWNFDFRAIELENGLKVLLIHKPTAYGEKVPAAASMVVEAGFFHEPSKGSTNQN